MNSVWLARYAAAGHRVSPNNEIVPSVFAARPRCRLVYANRNDDDREAGYKHLLFTMRQRLTRSCVIPAAPRPSLFLSHLSHHVFLRPPRPVSTPCQVHTRRAIRSACECVRVRVTLIIKRRIITARTRSEHRVYGTYLLHNNVPPLVVCRGGVGRARSSTGGGKGIVAGFMVARAIRRLHPCLSRLDFHLGRVKPFSSDFVSFLLLYIYNFLSCSILSLRRHT